MMLNASHSRREFVNLAVKGTVSALFAPAIANAAYGINAEVPDAERAFMEFDPLQMATDMGSDIFTRRREDPVSARIQLLMDISTSITEDDKKGREYTLQKNGTAAAFESAAVQKRIADHGGIACAVSEFSTQANNRVPWALLETKRDALVFAKIIRAIPLNTLRDHTGIIEGLKHSRRLMENCPYDAGRSVIDLSCDGVENVMSKNPNDAALALREASDLCASHGIICNGLAMPTQGGTAMPKGVKSVFGYLSVYYMTPSGKFFQAVEHSGKTYHEPLSGGFVVGVNRWADFPAAIETKLADEIAGLNPKDRHYHHPGLQFA